MSSGRTKYLPKIVFDEIDTIKKVHHYDRDSDALRKMVEHCRVGREVERITHGDFFKKPLSTKDIWPKKRRRR